MIGIDTDKRKIRVTFDPSPKLYKRLERLEKLAIADPSLRFLLDGEQVRLTFGCLIEAGLRQPQALHQSLDVCFSQSNALKPGEVEIRKSSKREVGGKLLAH